MQKAFDYDGRYPVSGLQGPCRDVAPSGISALICEVCANVEVRAVRTAGTFGLQNLGAKHFPEFPKEKLFDISKSFVENAESFRYNEISIGGDKKDCHYRGDNCCQYAPNDGGS